MAPLILDKRCVVLVSIIFFSWKSKHNRLYSGSVRPPTRWWRPILCSAFNNYRQHQVNKIPKKIIHWEHRESNPWKPGEKSERYLWARPKRDHQICWSSTKVKSGQVVGSNFIPSIKFTSDISTLVLIGNHFELAKWHLLDVCQCCKCGLHSNENLTLKCREIHRMWGNTDSDKGKSSRSNNNISSSSKVGLRVSSHSKPL